MSAGTSKSKRCFVTIGATASFDSLVRGVLEVEFLQALHGAGYTELRIQYGDEGKQIFDKKLREDPQLLKSSTGIDISGFGFDKSGLQAEMAAVKSSSSPGNERHEGVVISHAGSGSILDALRTGVPLVVVPNTDLLHNHQVEIAEVLAEQHYVVHGRLDALATAVNEAEQLRQTMRKWPPQQSRKEKHPNGLAGVMAEELGWLD